MFLLAQGFSIFVTIYVHPGAPFTIGELGTAMEDVATTATVIVELDTRRNVRFFFLRKIALTDITFTLSFLVLLSFPVLNCLIFFSCI